MYLINQLITIYSSLIFFEYKIQDSVTLLIKLWYTSIDNIKERYRKWQLKKKSMDNI